MEDNCDLCAVYRAVADQGGRWTVYQIHDKTGLPELHIRHLLEQLRGYGMLKARAAALDGTTVLVWSHLGVWD